MENNSDKELTITIQTPQGNWETTFPKTTKVQEVIDAVVKHFGFAPNGKYDLRLSTDPDNPLKPERTLVSYGIKDGDVLVFTDLGVAV
ncbi:MAG: EsaB/YukD family protein [Thaumarchaeota archaeon]|nr:EsaB/YukD family protein [Nitrososphaerota archaeon]